MPDNAARRARAFLLQSGIYDRFVSGFAEKAKLLRVGDPEDPQTQIGAITLARTIREDQGVLRNRTVRRRAALFWQAARATIGDSFCGRNVLEPDGV